MSTIMSIRRARGFSLIEMMVALLLTGILLVGVLTAFDSAGRTSRAQGIVAAMGDGGRFAMDTIARDLRMAGYRDSDWLSGPMTDSIAGVNGLAADGGDTLTIRYEAARDCTFAAAPAGLATNVYAVVDDAFQCNDQTIITGVEQMQVYFGEDISGDGVADRLLAPGTAGLDMTRVVSVRLHLLARMADNGAAMGPQSYYFDNAVQAALNDGQIRREYSLTVALRNPP